MHVNVDRQLLNDVCENYLQSGINNHEQTDIQINCSILHPTNVNPSSGNFVIFCFCFEILLQF